MALISIPKKIENENKYIIIKHPNTLLYFKTPPASVDQNKHSKQLLSTPIQKKMIANHQSRKNEKKPTILKTQPQLHMFKTETESNS